MRLAPWPLLLLALSLGSCAVSPTPPQGPEGFWYLSEFRLAEDQVAHQPRGARFTLGLDGQGGASGQVACNRWHGRYTTADGQLFVEQVAATRARCIVEDTATAQLEQVFLTRLASGGHMEQEREGLVLKFADGLRWHFRRNAPEG